MVDLYSFRRLLIVVLLVCLLGGKAIAQDFASFRTTTIGKGEVFQLPVVIPSTTMPRMPLPKGPIFSQATGIRLELHSFGFKETGYSRYEIKVIAKKNRPNERRVTIRVAEDMQLSIEKTIPLKANQKEVFATIYVPQLEEEGARFLWVHSVKINGLEDFDFFKSGINISPKGIYSINGVRIIAPFSVERASSTRQPHNADDESLSPTDFIRSHLIQEQVKEGLSNNWLSYTSADVVKIPLDRVESTMAEQSAEWRALMQWVATGGSLWITQTGDEAEALPKLTKQLELGDWLFDVAEEGELKHPETPGWKYDSFVLKQQSGDSAQEAEEARAELMRQGLEGVLRSLTKRSDSAGAYAWHPYGMGRVYAFSRTELDAPLGLEGNQQRLAIRQLESQNWPSRHGMLPGRKSKNFANLLIPGVGVAPVVEFQVLITLFVLAIGPLNYWLLWRWDRLHLLVLTTPLLATGITLGLLGYAMVCDGFGTQVRARSVTLLNQEKGEAVSWSRMTHYAGSAPVDGMLMPEGVAIYPISPSLGSGLFGSTSQERLLVWEGNQQRLASGWLPNRTAVQHLAIRNSKTEHRLDFLTPAKGPIEVSNQLGAKIELLLVQNELGDWSRGEAIAIDGKAVLEPIDLIKAIATFRILAIKNRPEMPVGAGKEAADMAESLSFNSYRRNDGYGIRTDMSKNRLNQMIERLSGVDGGKGLALPARSYVAVTRTAVETPLGVDDATESGSFHVTVGSW